MILTSHDMVKFHAFIPIPCRPAHGQRFQLANSAPQKRGEKRGIRAAGEYA